MSLSTIQCIFCKGRGQRWTGWAWAECVDCKGTGCIDHCAACAGRGKLWLGGNEYIDCPVCPSALGGVRKPKTIVFMGNSFAPARIGG